VPTKPPPCPACKRRMTPTGVSTADESVVWACPRCLTLYTRGRMKQPLDEEWRRIDRQRHPGRRAR